MDFMTLTKTGEGEFIIQGHKALQLLFEYFEQAPELWLRLLAVKAGEQNDAETTE